MAICPPPQSPAAAIIRARWSAAAPGDRFLHFAAFDLARGPGGQWRVLADRLRLATGVGYALENRLALSRSIGPLMGAIKPAASPASSPRCAMASPRMRRARPRLALLTPGRFNQSYPEQAHLARYLGLALVEGRDLTVADERLYVRTIAGRAGSMRCGAGSTRPRSTR